MQTVIKAVIPAAGLGSRMLPITKGVPKEMLPVGRKPMIQHVVEEAVASGLTQICIVIREGKETIRDYFTLRRDAVLKCDRHLDELEALVARCGLTFIYQREPRGLGDSLLAAREFVGDSAFVMLVPDQLMRAHVPAAQQLLEHWRGGATIWTSLVKLPKAEAPFFVGARAIEFAPGDGSNEYILGRILTEERAREVFANASDEVRGFGRTVYPPEIFKYLGADYTNPATGEIDLLITFAQATTALAHRGVLLQGEPLDLGTFEGYYRYLPRLSGAEE